MVVCFTGYGCFALTDEQYRSEFANNPGVVLPEFKFGGNTEAAGGQIYCGGKFCGTAFYMNDSPRGMTPILHPYRDLLEQFAVFNPMNWIRKPVQATVAEVVRSNGRRPWQITRENTEQVMRHPKFGKFYKSKNGRDWITYDNAGHGGSKFKRYEQRGGELQWKADLDEFGDDMKGKHKGAVGQTIPLRDLIPSTF